MSTVTAQVRTQIAAARVLRSWRIAFLTGAGISTESGIPPIAAKARHHGAPR